MKPVYTQLNKGYRHGSWYDLSLPPENDVAQYQQKSTGKSSELIKGYLFAYVEVVILQKEPIS